MFESQPSPRVLRKKLFANSLSLKDQQYWQTVLAGVELACSLANQPIPTHALDIPACYSSLYSPDQYDLIVAMVLICVALSVDQFSVQMNKHGQNRHLSNVIFWCQVNIRITQR
jgi:hypothetical protein